MKRYFAGESSHGSETSHGFCNDWTVYVFNNKKDRDDFVKYRPNLSTIAIKAKDATKHASNYSLTQNEYYRPKPFTFEFWGIEELFCDEDIKGCIGRLAVCNEDSYCVERLYK